ncbi:hypothetical protein D3C83_25380 [compost metagenome]
MEFQPVAQRERVGQLVRAEFPLVHHLRLDLELRIDREERVIDHVAVVARDIRGGRDRIEDAQVGLGNELQYLLPGLRVDIAARQQGCGHDGGSSGAGEIAERPFHMKTLL